MATTNEVEILKFNAEFGDIQQRLKDLEAQLRKLGKAEEEVTTEQKKGVTEMLSASQKRKAALATEQAELKKLQASLKSAFTAADIDKFNKAITKSKDNIKLLKGETDLAGKGIGGLKSQFSGLGAGIAAAFTVDALIGFSKASIEAFREAEVNANKLRFAVEAIGLEGGKAFEKLIAQSNQLQKISVFSDDDIQRSQTQLVQFGLTTDQVTLLIPKILDLASATGTDLASATDTLIQGINGQSRALKPLGLEFKNTGDKAENLAIISEKLNKFMGATNVAFETGAGQARNFENVVDDLQEKFGELLSRTGVIQGLTSGFKLIIDSFQTDSEKAQTQQDNFLRGRIDAFTKFNAAGRKAFLDDLEQEINFEKQRLNNAKDQTSTLATNQKFRIAALINEQTELKKLIAIEQGRIDNKLGKTDEQLAKEESAKLAAIQKTAEAEKKATDARLAEANRLAGAKTAIDQQIQDDAKKQIEKNADDTEKANQEIIKQDQKLNLELAKQDMAAFDEKEKAKTEALKKAEEERLAINKAAQDAALQVANDIANAIFQIQENNLKRSQAKETEALANEKEKALSNKRLTESQKEKINKEFAAKELALQKKQFEESKKLSLLEAIIKGALAVVTALASSAPPYNYILAAAVGVATGAEIAVIESQKFAKGKKQGQKGGPAYVGEQGTEFMYVPDNAMIVDAQKTRRHKALINAMMDGNLDDYLEKSFVLPRLQSHLKTFETNKEKSFSNNVAKALIFHGLTPVQAEKIRRKGITINNADVIIEGIVNGLTQKSGPIRRG